MSAGQHASGANRIARVTLVAGFDGAGKTTAVRRWLSTRPTGERWAVLANGLGAGLHTEADAEVEVFSQTAGCACCLAAVVLRPVLHRVLRRGPFDRVLIELAGTGEAPQMIDRLREAARGTPLTLDAVIAIVDASRPGPWSGEDTESGRLGRALAECADLILLTHGARDPQVGAALRARWSHGLFGPRPVLSAQPQPPEWPRVVQALRQVDAATRDPAPSPGSIALSADGSRCVRAAPGGGVLIEWRWPAGTLFDRRAAEAWTRQAETAGAQPGSCGVFPTSRDWYLWRPDGPQVWQPCGWRRDARVVCRLAQPPQADQLQALEQGLRAALRTDTA